MRCFRRGKTGKQEEATSFEKGMSAAKEERMEKRHEKKQEKDLMLAGVMDESIVDGPGIRYVVFVQGCPHRCEGCHNPQTHDFSGGQTADIPKILEEIDSDPMISGVTFSGGEPFCQAEQLCGLADEVKRRGKDLMIYSGYTYEELMDAAKSDESVKHLLETADRLVDGPFVLSQRDLELPFRGSRNQRYIDLVRTREKGEVVLADEPV